MQEREKKLGWGGLQCIYYPSKKSVQMVFDLNIKGQVQG